MLFNKGDVIEVSGISWSLEDLQTTLPNQLTNEVLNAADKQLSKYGEIQDISRKKVDDQEMRVYTVRFYSDHTMELTDEFMTEFVINHGPSVHARGEINSEE